MTLGVKMLFCSLMVLFVALVTPVFLKSDAMAMYGDTFILINSNINAGRNRIFDYSKHWTNSEAKAEDRASIAQTLTNHYYDVVTDFYEYGWGQSFHFAPRFKGESFDASLARHEHWLSSKLGLRPGMKVLDVGCGVGGPMRAIARFSGAQVVGLNNNAYQIERGQRALATEHLDDQCSFTKGDFMNMSFPNNSFDAAYAIEATCHAPSRLGVFSQMFRVVKPGGVIGLYEWVMTDKYNPKSAEDNEIKLGVEHGDSIPELTDTATVLAAVKDAGFEVLEHLDLAAVALESQKSFNVPWYRPLEGHLTISGFKHTPAGRMFTASMVWALEKLGIAAEGSYATAMMLEDGAHNLVLAGRKEILTPMFWIMARKPSTEVP